VPSVRAEYRLVGTGCPGSTTPTLVVPDRPIAGQPFTVGASGLPKYQLALLFFGFQDNFAGFPLPFDLTPVGMPGCWLYTSANIELPFNSGASGQLSTTVTLPYVLPVIGARFTNQVFVRDALAPNPLGVASTTGGVGIIGTR
jgi:hypothetical protein